MTCSSSAVSYFSQQLLLTGKALKVSVCRLIVMGEISNPKVLEFVRVMRGEQFCTERMESRCQEEILSYEGGEPYQLLILHLQIQSLNACGSVLLTGLLHTERHYFKH